MQWPCRCRGMIGGQRARTSSAGLTTQTKSFPERVFAPNMQNPPPRYKACCVKYLYQIESRDN